MSSAPSLQTSKKAERSEANEIEITFATTDEDAIELHRFLCVIAQPALMAPIDAHDSMAGVLNVVRNGAGISARLNGHIVGALGIIRGTWWYNTKAHFMVDRFFFVYPQFRHRGVGAALIANANAIALSANLPLIINGHQKRRGNGIAFTRPVSVGTTKKEMH